MTLAPQQAAFAVEITEDAGRFLAEAGDHLALDPVLATVVASNAQRWAASAERGDPRPPHPCWFAVVRDAGGRVVGAAMRAAPFEPHPLFVLPMPDQAARVLARAAVDLGEPVGGANGALPATRVFCEEVAALTGGTARLDEHLRLFELGDLREPAPPGGRLRAARHGDAGLLLAWFTAFAAEAAEQAGRVDDTPAFHTLEEMAQRIDEGRVWVWEDAAGEVVHLTGHSLPAYGVARVGPVYTPREQRGRGYAGAAVAGVSRMLRDGGSRVCLFTDQANPVSNRIYEALGYRPVVDMANLLVDG